MNKIQKDDKDKMEFTEEELKQLLEDINRLENNKSTDKKTIKTVIMISPFIFRNKIVSVLVMLAINIACFISILGIFRFFELNNIYSALIIPFCLLSFELFFKGILIKLCPKLIFKTLGIILYIITFFTSLFVLSYFQKDLIYVNNTDLFSFLVLFLIVRFVIISKIKILSFKHQFRKSLKE